MGELMRRICREDNLLAAWKATEASRPVEPAPAGEFEAFAERVLDNLADIERRLTDLSWRPGSLRKVEIPKADGRGKRLLEIPSVSDRVAERAVLQVITPVVDPALQPDSYAFRPGLGILDAIGAVQARVEEGADHLVRTDFVSCFDRVPRAKCLRAVGALVPDQEVVRILGRCVHRAGVRGVAQGSPLSPLLVNVFLDGLDRALWEQDVNPIRYSDDVVVAAFGGSDADRALAAVRRTAPAWGMELSPTKTGVFPVQSGVTFLGRTIRSSGQPRAQSRHVPQRISVYVTAKGAAVRARGERFVITTPDGVVRRQHAARTQRIVCSDRALLTTGALALAARQGVDIAITDSRNTFLGEFTHDAERGRLRVAQSQLGKSKRLAIAREMIAGKLANQRVLVQRTAARRKVVPAEIVKALADAKRRCHCASGPDQLMGIEGSAARRYFRALGAIVGPEWRFDGRNRQPPRDPVNAMLSYGYALLLGECRTAVRLAGLDPDIGVLHRQWRGRPGVALDLMEEFRPLITDTVVLRLVGTNQVGAADFTCDDAAGCRISPRGRRALIEEFERRMLTVVGYPALGRRAPYREVLVLQAEHLARAIGGQVPAYRPMPWR